MSKRVKNCGKPRKGNPSSAPRFHYILEGGEYVQSRMIRGAKHTRKLHAV